ncbi:MAG: XRE family transcriptional regulator [Clostridiales bacterium]|jgi:transcriptional regulator with XRE-family HTH domain|nr:XRE family transcriptional regulator [Clostridiales bacterium]
MTDQLIDIGVRLAALRDIMDKSVAETAAAAGVTPEEYEAYERGERDFSFSFLYRAAGFLGVDVLDIISGETPKLSVCAVVRGGRGFSVERRAMYDYKHLAFTFRDKLAEPFLVTVEPNAEPPHLNSHAGQEFDYMIEGAMEFYIGGKTYLLEKGDSVYFNSATPHGMKAQGGSAARFLAVVIGEREG